MSFMCTLFVKGLNDLLKWCPFWGGVAFIRSHIDRVDAVVILPPLSLSTFPINARVKCKETRYWISYPNNGSSASSLYLYS